MASSKIVLLDLQFQFLFIVAQEYEMNTWYYDIEDLTFETKFLQLTPEIIDALINASSYRSQKQDSTSISNVLESVSRQIFVVIVLTCNS